MSNNEYVSLHKLKDSYEAKAAWCLIGAWIMGIGTIGAFLEGEYFTTLGRFISVFGTLLLFIGYRSFDSSFKYYKERIEKEYKY